MSSNAEIWEFTPLTAPCSPILDISVQFLIYVAVVIVCNISTVTVIVWKISINPLHFTN